MDAVIDNAIKFTPGGKSVAVRVAVDGERVAVAVADSGPGLTDDELARVGDRFWRSARHQNVQGSGLGLSIARALLSQGGGGIAFGRREPHGLEVTLTVPRTAPVTTVTLTTGGRGAGRASTASRTGSSAPRPHGAGAGR